MYSSSVIRHPSSVIPMTCHLCHAQLTGCPALCPMCGARLKHPGRWLAASCSVGCLGLLVIVAGLRGLVDLALTLEASATSSPQWGQDKELCALGLIFIAVALILLFRSLAAAADSASLANPTPKSPSRLDPSKLPKTFSKDSERIKPPK